MLGQKVRVTASQGQKVQKVATRQPCGAVSLRCDATQQDCDGNNNDNNKRKTFIVYLYSFGIW